MIMENRRRKDSHIIEFYLPFYFVLSPYRIGPISVGTIGLLIVAFIELSNKNFKVYLYPKFRPYYIFLAYVLIRDFLKMFTGVDTVQTQINRMVEYLFVYILIFVICGKTIDENRLYKTWKVAGVIYAAGLIYHIVLVYFFNQRVSPINVIPGLSIQSEGYLGMYRPCSFFSEPAAYVTAMIPLEFLALKKNDFKWAVPVTLSILASTSTVGVILSIVLWGIMLVDKREGYKYRIIIISISIVLIVVFSNLELFSSSFSKFINVVEGGGTFGSRVQVSWEVIKTLSLKDLFIGTNYNEINTYVTSHIGKFPSTGITYRYWRSGSLFLNTFAQTIFRYGIIGILLLFSPFIRYLRTQGYEAKPYVITIMVAIFGQTMLLNPAYFASTMIMLLYMSSDLAIDEKVKI